MRTVVVRLDALGDTLLSTPAIDYLREVYGRENVLVLVSPKLGVVLGSSVLYAEVAATSSARDIATIIDSFEPDLVFVFTEKRRALRAAHLSKARLKIGFDPGWSQPLRSIEVKYFLQKRLSIVNSKSLISDRHEVERYCQLVAKGLSKKSIPAGSLRFFPVEKRQLAPMPVDAPLGFQWSLKWLKGGWGTDLLIDIIGTLPPATLIFVEPSELEGAKNLIPTGRLSKINCLPLVEYARAISTCRYLISIDTGAVHVAAAVGTPVIAVFPQEHADHVVPRWRPWLVPHQVVVLPDSRAGIKPALDRIENARASMESVLQWFKMRSSV